MNDELHKWKYYIAYFAGGGFGSIVVNTPTPINCEAAIETLQHILRRQTKCLNVVIINWQLLRKPSPPVITS